MKTNTIVVLMLSSMLGGCIQGFRHGNDRTWEQNNGVAVGLPKIGIGPVQLSTLDVRTKVKTSADEDTTVYANSIASKSGVSGFVGNTESKRGFNQMKKVNYGIQEIKTEAQADVVAAFFKGISDSVATYFSAGASPAIKAIVSSETMSAQEKKEAVLKLLPEDAPAQVRHDLETLPVVNIK